MDSATTNTNTGNTNSTLTGGNTVGGARQEDYGDKAFDAVAKKSGHNVDASTGEKITDGARGLFEKATGLVPSYPSICH